MLVEERGGPEDGVNIFPAGTPWINDGRWAGSGDVLTVRHSLKVVTGYGDGHVAIMPYNQPGANDPDTIASAP